MLYSRYEGYCSPVSCATVYLRDVFDKLGRFDESLYVGEDVEFNQRFDLAGFRHYFSQELTCYYYPRRNFTEFLKQMYNYGLGRTRASMGSGKMWFRDLAPIVAIGGILLLATATALALSWLFILPVLAYVVSIALYSLKSAHFHHKSLLWPYVFVALVIVHFGLAFGQFKGIIECAIERKH